MRDLVLLVALTLVKSYPVPINRSKDLETAKRGLGLDIAVQNVTLLQAYNNETDIIIQNRRNLMDDWKVGVFDARRSSTIGRVASVENAILHSNTSSDVFSRIRVDLPTLINEGVLRNTSLTLTNMTVGNFTSTTLAIVRADAVVLGAQYDAANASLFDVLSLSHGRTQKRRVSVNSSMSTANNGFSAFKLGLFTLFGQISGNKTQSENYYADLSGRIKSFHEWVQGNSSSLYANLSNVTPYNAVSLSIMLALKNDIIAATTEYGGFIQNIDTLAVELVGRNGNLSASIGQLREVIENGTSKFGVSMTDFNQSLTVNTIGRLQLAVDNVRQALIANITDIIYDLSISFQDTIENMYLNETKYESSLKAELINFNASSTIRDQKVAADYNTLRNTLNNEFSRWDASVYHLEQSWGISLPAIQSTAMTNVQILENQLINATSLQTKFNGVKATFDAFKISYFVDHDNTQALVKSTQKFVNDSFNAAEAKVNDSPRFVADLIKMQYTDITSELFVKMSGLNETSQGTTAVLGGVQTALSRLQYLKTTIIGVNVTLAAIGSTLFSALNFEVVEENRTTRTTALLAAMQMLITNTTSFYNRNQASQKTLSQILADTYASLRELIGRLPVEIDRYVNWFNSIAIPQSTSVIADRNSSARAISVNQSAMDTKISTQAPALTSTFFGSRQAFNASFGPFTASSISTRFIAGSLSFNLTKARRVLISTTGYLTSDTPSFAKDGCVLGMFVNPSTVPTGTDPFTAPNRVFQIFGSNMALQALFNLNAGTHIIYVSVKRRAFLQDARWTTTFPTTLGAPTSCTTAGFIHVIGF